MAKTNMLDEGSSSISPTVSSVTDLPIPSQKSTGDLKGKTPQLLRKPSRIKHRPQDDIEVQSLSQGEDVLRQLENGHSAFQVNLASRTKPRSVHLTDLPIEVQETILDHLAGSLISTAHVRHFEVWVPIWEMKAGRRTAQIPSLPGAFSPRLDAVTGYAVPSSPRTIPDSNDMSLTFQQASQNATLEDIFFYACALFPEACVLTIEGGQGKRSPMIKAFRTWDQPPCSKSVSPKIKSLALRNHRQSLRLPVHPKIGTVVIKGAWNIIRFAPDFDHIAAALPNLREWHCIYAKPKVIAYRALCTIMRSPPPTLLHLNICLDSLCSKPCTFPEKWRAAYREQDLCHQMGLLAPHLESLSFTGRVCGQLFRTAGDVGAAMRDVPKLKSVDLIVRNCCRDSSRWNESTGIYNLAFIAAFTGLVTEAVRSLVFLPQLNFLRIRFIDLDSQNPLLNPYFHLQGTTVTGIWNEEILSKVREARPEARFEGLEYCEQGWGSRGMVGERGVGGGRPRSICVDTYALIIEAAV
ncbi:MAG: hypothetical protein Q9190_007483 [Brigantiaea leucoxantha]